MISDLVLEFLEHVLSKQSLTMRTERGVRIRVIERDSRLQLVILVDDKTRKKHVLDSDTWDEVEKWRDALMEWQGPTLNPRTEFYENLDNLHQEQGLSYRQIAQKVNEKLAELLRECVNSFEPGNEQGKAESLLRDLKMHVLISQIRNTLRYCRPRLTEQMTIEYFKGACERIQSGGDAFLPGGGPVAGDDIKARLRSWRGEKTG